MTAQRHPIAKNSFSSKLVSFGMMLYW